MYSKSDSTIAFQEFLVKKYSLQRISELLDRSTSSYLELIQPTLQFLLPGTRFYVRGQHAGLIPGANVEIILHPLALGLKDRGIKKTTIAIQWTNLIKTGPLIHLPTMSFENKISLDTFRARYIFEKRGLPKAILADRQKQNEAIEWYKREALNMFTSEDEE